MIDLLELPLEVWWVLSGQLYFWHIMRLYMCGNRRLIDLMTRRGGVNDVCITISGSNPKLGWIPQISEFLNVRRFKYDCGDCSGGTRYIISTEDLKMIPPSIRELHLFSDNAGASFVLSRTKSADSGAEEESYGPRLIVSEQWPNLVHFAYSAYLETSDWSPSETDLLKTLPPTLTSLRNENYVKPNEDFFECLPRDLVHLRIPNAELRVEQLLLLHPQLETFVAVVLQSENPEEFDVAEYWSKLPPGLTHLSIHSPNQNAFPVGLLDHLPLSLTYLNIAQTITSATFPGIAKRYRHLKHLSITHSAHVGIWTAKDPDTLALKHIHRIIQMMSSWEEDIVWTFQDDEWIQVR